ncbi:Protein of unknown function [Bacillus cereus]|nr:Protein of unknown function [Bacillus wiedmannii]SCN31891.1 Protein of unknown function [Bacillus cereus]
MQVEILLV